MIIGKKTAEWLHLRNNHLSDISALSGLNKLTWLYLPNNQLKALPEWLLDFNLAIKWETNFKDNSIFLEDNPFSTPEHTLIKFNPLLNWSSEQVWDHIEAYQVPYNKLHKQGFISIGCEPCTRAVLPNQHERTGRWWWESGIKKSVGYMLGI